MDINAVLAWLAGVNQELTVAHLFDRGSNLVPFRPYLRPLAEKAAQVSKLGPQQGVFYYSGTPGEHLYHDPATVYAETVEDVYALLHARQAVVVIVSDAGAVNGWMASERLVSTERFLHQLKHWVREIVWLNPMPPHRWFDTAAETIASFVPMFDLSPRGLAGASSVLRGEPHGDEPVWVTPRPAPTSSGELPPWVRPEQRTKEYEGHRRIDAFARRHGEAHLLLAMHAAFPIGLTPDLLDALATTFTQDVHGKPLAVSWEARADLLLSALFDESGYETFEMKDSARSLLLGQLQASPDFGARRLRELAEFLLEYTQRPGEGWDHDLDEVHRWTALAYLRPREAARDLASALKERLEDARADHRWDAMRIAELIERFATPLAGFPHLLAYARGAQPLVRGDLPKAQAQWRSLPLAQGSGTVEVAGVALPLTLGAQ